MSEHGNAYVCIGRFAPLCGESGGFGAHDDGGGTCHVGIVVEFRVLQLCGKDGNSLFLQPCNGLVAVGGGTWDGECRSQRCADKVGIVEVGQRVAHDDGCGTGGVGSAEW